MKAIWLRLSLALCQPRREVIEVEPGELLILDQGDGAYRQQGAARKPCVPLSVIFCPPGQLYRRQNAYLVRKTIDEGWPRSAGQC